MESAFGSQSVSGLISGAIFVYISTALNLGVRLLLVIGAIAVYKHLGKTTRLCLLLGSILYVLSAIPTSPIFTFLISRGLTPAQYGNFAIATGIVSNLAFLIFAFGFYRFSNQFVRMKSRH